MIKVRNIRYGIYDDEVKEDYFVTVFLTESIYAFIESSDNEATWRLVFNFKEHLANTTFDECWNYYVESYEKGEVK